jgi:hypothetical protein
MLRIVWIADADMAVGIDHVLFGKDTIGDNEVFDDGIEIAHVAMTRCS